MQVGKKFPQFFIFSLLARKVFLAQYNKKIIKIDIILNQRCERNDNYDDNFINTFSSSSARGPYLRRN